MKTMTMGEKLRKAQLMNSALKIYLTNGSIYIVTQKIFSVLLKKQKLA